MLSKRLNIFKSTIIFIHEFYIQQLLGLHSLLFGNVKAKCSHIKAELRTLNYINELQSNQEKWSSITQSLNSVIDWHSLRKSSCMNSKSFQSCLSLCDLMECRLQVPLSMEFSRKEFWSVLPCPPPWDLPNLGTKPEYW